MEARILPLPNPGPARPAIAAVGAVGPRRGRPHRRGAPRPRGRALAASLAERDARGTPRRRRARAADRPPRPPGRRHVHGRGRRPARVREARRPDHRRERAGRQARSRTSSARTSRTGTGVSRARWRSSSGDRGALQKFVKDLFDETKRDSAIGRIGGLLGQYFDGDRSKVAVLLDPTRLGSPLHQFRQEITEGFKGVHERLTAIEAASKARADERAKSAAKGGDFEVLLHGMLGDLARGSGDLAGSHRRRRRARCWAPRRGTSC